MLLDSPPVCGPDSPFGFGLGLIACKLQRKWAERDINLMTLRVLDNVHRRNVLSLSVDDLFNEPGNLVEVLHSP